MGGMEKAKQLYTCQENSWPSNGVEAVYVKAIVETKP